MTITGAQVKAARALLNWSRVKSASKCEMPFIRILEFETGTRNPSGALADRLRRALESAGVEFTNGGQPGVRMKAAGGTIPAGELNASNDSY